MNKDWFSDPNTQYFSSSNSLSDGLMTPSETHLHLPPTNPLIQVHDYPAFCVNVSTHSASDPSSLQVVTRYSKKQVPRSSRTLFDMPDESRTNLELSTSIPKMMTLNQCRNFSRLLDERCIALHRSIYACLLPPRSAP
jgi:hypothetical protein